MARGTGTPGLTASPVLVGAVTLLVAIVAVFLSYNANAGLPFVPTYDLEADVPNAANLVKGNDVRIGGARVGSVSKISPVASASGKPTARLHLKLDKELEPLPVDTTMIVRPRSALGLKYVELTPGRSKAGFQAGSAIPLQRATPTPVEIDEVFNIFDAKTRRGAQQSLNGFGTGFAGRGRDLNDAITALNPLLSDLEPVAKNLADSRTGLAKLFPALEATARQVAPVAETQAALFGNLDTTFTALSGIARPYLQEFISEGPPTLDTGISEFPRQRPFLRNTAAFFGELKPGVQTLPASAPVLADAFEAGRQTLPRTPSLNRRLGSAFDALADFADDPLVPRGIQRLASVAKSLRPTVAFLTPVQTQCNYVKLLARNGASIYSEGDRNGTFQRFIIIGAPVGPNNEGSPSSRPASGPEPENFLHSNPYPNTASPGQGNDCESGKEVYAPGKVVTGTLPGSQGLVSEGKTKAETSAVSGVTP